MGKIERYFAGKPMPTQAFPRAPAKQLADTGQGLEAEALAGLGGALTDVSAVVMKWYEREGNTQFDTQRRLVRERLNEFESTDFPDADSHDAGYKTMRADAKKLTPKNKSGARKFQSWMDYASPTMDRISDEKKIRMIALNNQKEYFKNISAIGSETDFAKAQSEARLLTQGAVDDKTRTPAQAASDYNKAMGDWLSADVWRRATAMVRPDDEVDWAEAVEWFSQKENIEGLDESITGPLSARAKSELTAQKRRDDDKLKELQESQRDSIYTMIESNAEETVDTINDSTLPAKEKADLRKLAGNPDIPLNYPEYDKVVDIIDGVGRDTHTIEQADQAIKDGIGKYFDATIARSLRTKLSQNSKADSPTKRPAHTRGLTAIEEIMDAKISWAKKTGTYIDKEGEEKDYDFEAESKDLQKKHRLKNDLDVWALEKDRTDEEIEKKVELLTTPVKEKITQGLLGRLWELFVIGTGGRGFLAEKPKTFIYTAINPNTSERMGSNDGVKWQPIQ